MAKMEYQVTLFCKSKKYKPVSTIIKAEAATPTATLLKLGAEKICRLHNWTTKDLARCEYTSGKVREYDKEKIEAENKARYEKIKEEKYASGEWKRPKEG